MKQKSKDLLKHLLYGLSFDTSNYEIQLAISIYCEANEINEDEFRKKIDYIHSELYNHCYTKQEQLENKFYKMSKMYVELLLP